MRFSTTPNLIPDSSPPFSVEKGEQYVWGNLALRLVHPLRVAIIEALYRCEQPLSVGDLASVLSESEDLIRYHSKALVREGVLEVVEVRPRGGEGGDEAFLDFPQPSEEALRPEFEPAL